MSDPRNASPQGHGPKCPSCAVDLVMSERQGIEIDYCPQCRGIWLDRGELDKIIERSQDAIREQPTPSQPYPDQQAYGHHGSGHGKHGYRRKSWLSELFD